jgi:hypothetical protein
MQISSEIKVFSEIKVKNEKEGKNRIAFSTVKNPYHKNQLNRLRIQILKKLRNTK